MLQVKQTPYNVLNYPQLLLNGIGSVYANIDLGGTGVEQALNLQASLKTAYRKDIEKHLESINKDYNNKITHYDAILKKNIVGSEKIKVRMLIKQLQRNYSRLVVQLVIEVLEKYGGLEATRSIDVGGEGFQSFMGNQ